MAIRQAYLAGVGAQDASLAHAHLTETALADGFDYPTAVALSADGASLVVGTSTGELRLWRAADRTLLARLEGHTGQVQGVALSADGHLVASGGFDGTVRLWDAKSGACLCTLQPERRYERLDITGLTGVTAAQRSALLALGALEQHGPTREPTATW